MIKFNEEQHLYKNSLTGEHYISVTQLISKYKKPFDTENMSLYKAIKDVYSGKSVDMWKKFLRSCGGWEKVVPYWKKINTYKEEILKRQGYYVELWDKIRDDACEKGSVIHKALENDLVSSEKVISWNTEFLVKSDDFQIKLEDGVYAETKVWLPRYRLAGTVDVLYVDGMDIYIEDYKTNKEITKDAFNDEKMLYPVQHLPNSNYWHYVLQLSMYAYMIESIGDYRVKGLYLKHIRESGNVRIELPYLKSDIINILSHYDREDDI